MSLRSLTCVLLLVAQNTFRQLVQSPVMHGLGRSLTRQRSKQNGRRVLFNLKTMVLLMAIHCRNAFGLKQQKTPSMAPNPVERMSGNGYARPQILRMHRMISNHQRLPNLCRLRSRGGGLTAKICEVTMFIKAAYTRNCGPLWNSCNISRSCWGY